MRIMHITKVRSSFFPSVYVTKVKKLNVFEVVCVTISYGEISGKNYWKLILHFQEKVLMHIFYNNNYKMIHFFPSF